MISCDLLSPGYIPLWRTQAKHVSPFFYTESVYLYMLFMYTEDGCQAATSLFFLLFSISCTAAVNT